MEKQKNKKINWIYIILILLIIICVGIIISLVIKNEKTLTPDFAPGIIDTNAIKEQEDDDKMNVSNGGGAVSLSYSNIVSINNKKKDVKMFFKNPSKSHESIVLEIVIRQKEDEFVISKSELLPPGYALYNMNLDSTVELPVGGYNGYFRITYYNEETGIKQIVNTEIEISIEVS